MKGKIQGLAAAWYMVINFLAIGRRSESELMELNLLKTNAITMV